jgi:hypothetical protein
MRAEGGMRMEGGVAWMARSAREEVGRGRLIKPVHRARGGGFPGVRLQAEAGSRISADSMNR